MINYSSDNNICVEICPYDTYHFMAEPNAVILHRIDPTQNMARFYALDVQRDLFGGILLVRQWGRIGTHGRIAQEMFSTEAQAIAALREYADSKRQRGYR
jgi:predicted DNA-binding WGR domain protein